MDHAEHSVSLWSGGELLAYGGTSAMQALAQSYVEWTSYGLPGLAGLALQVVRTDDLPEGNGNVCTEPRGATMVFNSEVENGYRDEERTLLTNMASKGPFD